MKTHCKTPLILLNWFAGLLKHQPSQNSVAPLLKSLERVHEYQACNRHLRFAFNGSIMAKSYMTLCKYNHISFYNIHIYIYIYINSCFVCVFINYHLYRHQSHPTEKTSSTSLPPKHTAPGFFTTNLAPLPGEVEPVAGFSSKNTFKALIKRPF